MRILVITKRPPWPIHHGDRLHCYELVRRLARRHEILLVAQQPAEDGQLPPDFRCWVARDGRLYDDQLGPTPVPFQPSRIDRYFGIDPAFAMDVDRFVGDWRPNVVIGMNYLMLPVLARLTDVPTVCDLLDDEAFRALLEFASKRVRSRWETLKCFAATLLFQRRHIRRVSAVTVLSQADRRFCQLHTGHPDIRCIPHGVDCKHYTPSDEPVDSKRIIFWGSLGFGPNTGAIQYFADKVWPLVRRHRPDLIWTIAGKGDSPLLERIKHLAGVDWRGFVDDLRPLIARSAVAIAPLQTGAGIKNKIMEAWAMGKPLLCTPRALGSLPGTHGQNVWLAKSPRALASGLLKLLDDADLRARLGQAARRTAVEQCSWDHAALQLERLCIDLALEQPIRYNVELPPVEQKAPTTASSDRI